MDSPLVIAIILAVLSWLLLRRHGLRRQKLPPGPYPFPIIGNIHQLGRQPHKSLTELAKTYGPLMSLQLGRIFTVVATSPEAAKLVLQEHDQVFSGRFIPAATEVDGFSEISVGLIPVGEKWKRLRKLHKEQLFSSRRLDSGEGLRREKLEKLFEYVDRCRVESRAVNLGEAAFVTALNLLTATFFSVDLIEFGSDASQELKETIESVTSIFGKPNVADFFPLLKRWDPQGIKKQSAFCIGKLQAILQGLIDERLKSRSSSAASPRTTNDFLDTLLDSMGGSEYNLSLKEIKQLLLDLFIGGSETTQSSVQWVMAELLGNQEKMRNLKNELTSVIGKGKHVEESDVSRLPYLRAVIKETLRLHPPAPFLIPRKADREVEISGYIIPKNAQIFVNVWAIGRDPSVWPNPNSFEPERFLGNKVDFKGHDFAYLPFGSGRRVCPGMALADRMLPPLLGSLINTYEWKLEEGEEVDMTEVFGMALHKAVPLKAIPSRV